MSTPIGSIEFLVKFDTLSDSFKDAMKDAINDSDIEFDTDDITQIKDDISYIRWNIATRLRQPFGIDYRAARVQAVPELNFTQEEDSAREFAQKLRGFGGSRPAISQGEDESDEDYEERSMLIARKVLDEYAFKLIKLLKPGGKEYWLDNQKSIRHLQNIINEAMRGSWDFVQKDLLSKLIDERTILTDAAVDWLESIGFEAFKSQKRWSTITREFGEGGVTPITSTKEIIKAFQEEGITEDILKEIEALSPKKDKGKASPELRAFAERLRENRTFGPNAQLPNILLWLMEEFEKAEEGEDFVEFWGKIGRGKFPDLMIKGFKDKLEQHMRGLEIDLTDKETAEMREKMEEAFTTSDIFLDLMELGSYYPKSKQIREELLGRERVSLRGRVSGGSDVDFGIDLTEWIKDRLIPQLMDDLDLDEEGDREENARLIVGELLKQASGLKDVVTADQLRDFMRVIKNIKEDIGYSDDGDNL